MKFIVGIVKRLLYFLFGVLFGGVFGIGAVLAYGGYEVKDGIIKRIGSLLTGCDWDVVRKPKPNYTSYNMYKPKKRYSDIYKNDKNTKIDYETKSVVYSNKEDANKVLSNLQEIAETYCIVSVADLHDLSGIYTSTFTDYDLGWTYDDLLDVEVLHGKNGWFIDLPTPRKIS